MQTENGLPFLPKRCTSLCSRAIFFWDSKETRKTRSEKQHVNGGAIHFAHHLVRWATFKLILGYPITHEHLINLTWLYEGSKSLDVGTLQWLTTEVLITKKNVIEEWFWRGILWYIRSIFNGIKQVKFILAFLLLFLAVARHAHG